MRVSRAYTVVFTVVLTSLFLMVLGGPVSAGADLRLMAQSSDFSAAYAAVDGWYGTDRDYRVTVVVNADGTARVNRKPVEVALNFTDLLADAGQTGAFDEDSILVVEVNPSGSLVRNPVGHQMDKGAAYNATTDAQATLIFLLDGTTAANATRLFQIYFDVTGKGFAPPTTPALLTFMPDVVDEGLTTYRITTTVGTLYYDVVGGGFSSFNDVDGQDWISWNLEGDSVFRGIPDMVFNPPKPGGFHPGKSGIVTTKLHSGPLHVRFRSTLANDTGTWLVIWDIFPDYARMTVTQTAGDYWFLYEGTPGGVFDSADIIVRSDGTSSAWNQTWCRDTVSYVDAATFCARSTGMWDEEWAYFADPNAGSSGRALYVHTTKTTPS